MARYTVIKVKRTPEALTECVSGTEVGNTILNRGEPFLFIDGDNKYITFGDGNTPISNLPKTKLGDGVYFKSKSKNGKTVNVPQDLYGNDIQLYIDTSTIYDDGKGAWLSDILDSITGDAETVKVTKGTDEEKIYIIGTEIENIANATESHKILKYCGGGSTNNSGIYFNAKTGVLFGAAWNDFAEYRECTADAGRCVIETGTGELIESTERLMPGASIISDTYGMVVGSREEGYNPIAVAGRVLAYPADNEFFTAGQCVCSGPNGTISAMSREEIKNYPDAIVGTVSEFPSYDEWNGRKVNGRIWIKLR